MNIGTDGCTRGARRVDKKKIEGRERKGLRLSRDRQRQTAWVSDCKASFAIASPHVKRSSEEEVGKDLTR